MRHSDQALVGRSVDDHTPTSVCIAIVLYHNSLDEVWRCVRAVRASVNQVLTSGRPPLTTIQIRIGDCSDHPLVSEGDIRAIRADLDPRVAVSYQWFANNLGHSAGSNVLAQNAAEDALLFLNPDTYMAPTSLAALLSSLRDPHVSAVDARQIPCEHPKAYDPIVGDQSWASGACLLVRSSRFHEVAGFDAETFPSYVNDVDLSWRLRLQSGRVVHQPRAVVFHDKRLDKNAGVQPTRTELYQATLGRLLLATKYSRSDIVTDTIKLVEDHRNPNQLRAVLDFERRRSSGALPAAVPEGNNVAQFIDGDYARKLY